MEVKRLLMNEARLHGICKDGLSDIRTCKDKGALLEYYKKTIDWSLENDYPTLEQSRELFTTDELGKHGIYIDSTFDGDTFSSLQCYVFHNCKGYINVAMDYDNAVIPMLYFANGCNVEVYCGQRNTPPIKVPVYVFGDNNVTCYDNDNAKFTIYRKEVKHE